MGLAAALAIGLVLLTSAVGKLTALPVFAEQIADYKLIPYRATRPAAFAVTTAEITLAIFLLVVPGARRVAAAAATLLLLVFVAALVSAVRKHRRIDCACFGVFGRSKLDAVGLPTILRTSVLAAVAAAGTLPHDDMTFALSLMTALAMLVIAFLVGECGRLFTDLRRRTNRIVADLRLDERTQGA